jgi:phosphate-selective porin OprO/OprP
MTRTSKSSLGGAASVAVWSALAGSAHGQNMSDQELKQKSLEERVQALEAKLDAHNEMNGYFGLQSSNKGLKFESPDHYFKVAIGGRIEFDAEANATSSSLESTKTYSTAGSLASLNTIGAQNSDWEIRRTRINLEGSIGDHVEWKNVLEFVKNGSADKEVYVGFYNLGDWLPNVRAGQMYEPFGQNQTVSDVDLTFLDFAAAANAFCPFSNPGFLVRKDLKDHDKNTRLTWQAGVFRPDGNVGDDSGVGTKGVGGYAFTGRLTGRPWYDDGDFLHVGVSLRHASVAGHNQTVVFSATPETHLFPSVVSTGAFVAQTDTKVDLESAFVKGPFSLEGEYIVDHVHTGSASPFEDPTFHGYYGQVAYTLTGERRGWKPLDALFMNPTPSHNAFENGGIGAWEVAARYSALDLNDGAPGNHIAGGRMEIVSLGLNWYVSQVAKVMWDVDRAQVSPGDPRLGRGGSAFLVQMRVQVAF